MKHKTLTTLAAILLASFQCIAATIQFAVTNTDLTPFTNYLSIYPLATPIYVGGTWSIRGQASRLPFTNGLSSIRLAQGNYLATNAGYYIAFTVPTNDTPYHVEELVIPGSVGSEWAYVSTNYATTTQLTTTSNALYSAIGTGGGGVVAAGTNVTVTTNGTVYTVSATATGTATNWTDAGGADLSNIGGITATGTVSAAAFAGDGSALTGLLATNAATLWVNSGGTTGQRGVKEKPYPTLTAAIAAAQAGDTLIVSGVQSIPTNTAVNNLTIRGEGALLTYGNDALDGESKPVNGLILSNATLAGLTISNSSAVLNSAVAAPWSSDGFGTLVIRDCVFVGKSFALLLKQPDNLGNNLADIRGCSFFANTVPFEAYQVNTLNIGNRYVSTNSTSWGLAVTANDSSTNLFIGCSFEASRGADRNVGLKCHASSHTTASGCQFKVRRDGDATNNAAIWVAELQTHLICNNGSFDIDCEPLLRVGDAPTSSTGNARVWLHGAYYWPLTNGVIVYNNPKDNGGPTVSNYFTLSGGNVSIENLLYKANTAGLSVTIANPPIRNLDGTNITDATITSNAFGATAIEFIQAAGGGSGEYATNAPNGTPLNDMQYGSAALTNLASGNGSGLTNLPAVPIQAAILSRYGLQITANTIHADAGPLFLLGETVSDGVSIHGDVYLTAGGYHGDGLDLINLNASNLSSGTVPVERLPTNSAVAWAGKNIWAGDAIFTGTVSNRGATYFGSTGQASVSSAGAISTVGSLNGVGIRNNGQLIISGTDSTKTISIGGASYYTNTLVVAEGTSVANFSPVLTEFYKPIQASASITATNGFDLPPLASSTTNLGALKIWGSNNAAMFVKQTNGVDSLLWPAAAAGTDQAVVTAMLASGTNSFVGDGTGLTNVVSGITNTATLWVNAGGATGERGLIERPYPTLEAAAADAELGDTLIVSGPITLRTNTAVTNLTIIGNGGVLSYPDPVEYADGLILWSNCTLSGLVISNSSAGTPIDIGSSTGVRQITDCRFYGDSLGLTLYNSEIDHTTSRTVIYSSEFLAHGVGLDIWKHRVEAYGSRFSAEGGYGGSAYSINPNDDSLTFFTGCSFSASGAVSRNAAVHPYARSTNVFNNCWFTATPSATSTNDYCLLFTEASASVTVNNSFFDLSHGARLAGWWPVWSGGIDGTLVLNNCSYYPETNGVIVDNIPKFTTKTGDRFRVTVIGGNLKPYNFASITNGVNQWTVEFLDTMPSAALIEHPTGTSPGTNAAAVQLWNSNNTAVFVRGTNGTDKLLLDLTQ